MTVSIEGRRLTAQALARMCLQLTCMLWQLLPQKCTMQTGLGLVQGICYTKVLDGVPVRLGVLPHCIDGI